VTKSIVVIGASAAANSLGLDWLTIVTLADSAKIYLHLSGKGELT
jgi:hypothetical protein